MKTVLVPLAKGFEEIEAVTIIDVLRRAQVDVLVASLDHTALVLGANGIVIEADVSIDNVVTDILDMIILPGGWDGTYALADNKIVQNILKEMQGQGKTIAAICAAPFALNKAGVLPQNYTCYPSVEEQIRLDGYQGDKAMIVEDGNVITSRGPGTAMCFALEIVKKLQGEETYNMLKEGLLATYCK
jgi:4-methyl-5(b-hydroxyethyl)-thiazole monophosphate biosynthesis